MYLYQKPKACTAVILLVSVTMGTYYMYCTHSHYIQLKVKAKLFFGFSKVGFLFPAAYKSYLSKKTKPKQTRQNMWLLQPMSFYSSGNQNLHWPIYMKTRHQRLNEAGIVHARDKCVGSCKPRSQKPRGAKAGPEDRRSDLSAKAAFT